MLFLILQVEAMRSKFVAEINLLKSAKDSLTSVSWLGNTMQYNM